MTSGLCPDVAVTDPGQVGDMQTEQRQDGAPPPPPPGQPAATPARPQLRRSTGDKMIGGVCGGLGRRFGLDPILFRVAFVVSIFLFGAGLLAYLAAWLIVPTDADPTPGPLTRSWFPLILGIFLAVGALGAGLGWVSELGGIGGLALGALVVGLGIWFYNNRSTNRGRTGSVGQAQPAAATELTADPNLATTGFAYGGTGAVPGNTAAYGYSGAPTTPYVPVAAPPRRPRSFLGAYTLLAALMVGGIMAALIAADAIALGLVGYLAILLGVIAIGLVVGAFYGRARWLILPGLILALMIGGVAQIPANFGDNFTDGVGERSWAPTSAAQDYELGVGEATLDLTAWAENPAAAQPVIADALAANVGAGQLNVLVPETWRVALTADVGLGALNINRVPWEDQAASPEYSGVLLPTTQEAGAIALDLSMGLGEINVRQVEVTEPAVLQDSASGTETESAGEKAAEGKNQTQGSKK